VILYPAIDIRGGGAVRLTQGDYERETRYDADPVDAAARWAGHGARFLHVVDLDGAKTGQPQNLGAVRRIAAGVSCPIQVGGGLRDAASVEDVLRAGAKRVVIGTAALRDPAFLEAMLQRHGDRVVVSVDARGGRVSIAGWTETSEVDAAVAISDLSTRGVPRFLFTPIEVDGTMEGPNLGELDRVAAATSAEILYSGGIGDLDDLRTLAVTAAPNVTGAIVGRALYENRFTVAEAEAALAEAADSRE
jgi:phosphoribosylformimino-5-aminoimidazole carboxamide ribotide isomerase